MPTTPARPTDVHRADLARQVVLLLSGGVAALGLAVGSGLLGGTPVAQAAGSAFADDATLVAPAGPAFSIWSVVYAGLVALAVWQAAPSRRSHPRLRAAGGPLALSMVANTAWILASETGAVGLTVVVIAVVLTSLVLAYAALLRSAPLSRAEAVLLDGTTGLYLGWVTVAVVANVAAWLTSRGLGELAPGAASWAVAVLAVAALVGVAVTRAGGRRLAYPAALVWGLAWVAVARTGGDDASPAVVVAAVLAALAVAGAAARGVTRRR